MFQYLVSLIRSDERGQGLAEYALILALIAVLAIAAVTFLGGQINAILSDVGTWAGSRSPQATSEAPAERPAPFLMPSGPYALRSAEWRTAARAWRSMR